MPKLDDLFLSVFSAALRGEKFDPGELTSEEWETLFRLAEEQKLLSLVLDTVYFPNSLRALSKERCAYWRDHALGSFSLQSAKQNAFLTLMLHAREEGLIPVVMKGIVCRSLYPLPLLRPSVDEDLLISRADAARWHAFMLREGLTSDHPVEDPSAVDELSYHKPDSPLYVELHIDPFPAGDTFIDCNRLFDGALSRAVPFQAEDVPLMTLAPTEHLLYLILHAFKHFLFSGFGFRLVSDVCLFASHYADEIDFAAVRASCEIVNAASFADAVFAIGARRLGLPTPAAYSAQPVDEGPMLADLFASGLLGAASDDRLHSARLTLDAVDAAREGRAARGLLHSLFPGKAYLQNNYTYAREHPVLLPVAWANRLVNYLLSPSSPAPGEALRIGRERVALLRFYGILPDDR